MSAVPAQKVIWSLRLWWVLTTPNFPDDETSRGALPDLTNVKYSHFLPFVLPSLGKHDLVTMCTKWFKLS